MTLRADIQNGYIDGNGLVSPHHITQGELRASDNGVSFSSEYYIQLKKNGELSYQDCLDYVALVDSCALQPGLISRAPKDIGLQPPDDYISLLAACAQLNINSIPLEMLHWGYNHYGSYNNANPSVWTTASFLWRQPQLFAACRAVALSPKYNPLQCLLNAYAALCIAVAGYNAPVNDQQVDKWRLTYLLSLAMEGSILTSIATKIWKRRMVRLYGPQWLAAIYAIYFKGENGQLHPLAKWAKE